MLTVLNKIDRLPSPEGARQASEAFPHAVAISALRGDGIPELLQAVSEKLYATYEPLVVDLPYEEGGLIALFHEMGQVEEVQHHRGGVRIRGRVPGRLVARYAPFVVGREEQAP